MRKRRIFLVGFSLPSLAVTVQRLAPRWEVRAATPELRDVRADAVVVMLPMGEAEGVSLLTRVRQATRAPLVAIAPVDVAAKVTGVAQVLVGPVAAPQLEAALTRATQPEAAAR